EAVLRPVDARHGAERSAAKIAVISNLEIAECERDGVHVGAAHAKSPDHEPVERRRANPDAADPDAVQPAARTDAHPAQHEARPVVRPPLPTPIPATLIPVTSPPLPTPMPPI